MNRNHRLSFSWLAIVLCMALLMTGMPFAPAYAKSKSKDKKETYYTIKWKVNGETVKKDKVKKGKKPEKPQDPADYSDGKYTYVFSGWDPKVAKATKDMTYKAKFKKTERTFMITWLDDKGKLIDFTQVRYGKLPTHEDPKKKASEKYTYTFDGWEPKLAKAKADATYTATFKKEVRKYKVTWVDDKGNVIDQTKVAYGKMPTHEDPVKKSSKATYIFTGWKPELAKVTGDVTYTATFKKDDQFTITWKDDEGNVIDTTKVEPGKKPTHDDPTKEPTEQYTYTFTGWEPKVVKAKADATYTATFKKKTRKYTITWLDDEGNLIDETKVAYGKLPTHDDPTLEETKTSTYVFKGWDPELAEVTGDATYTAVFEEVPKAPEATEAPEEDEQPATYTVTWLDDEGDVIDTTTVQAGEVPTHEDPKRKATEKYKYIFEGWTPELVEATADATYTAVFTEALRSYAITWLDDAGETIDTTKVPYGEMPEHDDPVKASTDTATYAFAGWEPELAPVTGKATYTATFTETVVGETAPETEDADMAEGNSVVVRFEYADRTLINYPQSYVETEEPQQVYYEGEDPITEDTDDSAYEWIGWTDDDKNTIAEEAQYGKSRNEDEKPLLPKITVDSPAETVYYAVFKEIPKHTVTWVIDGKPETTKVAEGQKPTRDDPAKQGFKFDGWLAEGVTEPIATADLPAMGTANVTYTAQFTADTILYDITWVIDGVEEVTPFEAGVQPTHDDPVPATEGYEFAGWSDGKKLYQTEELPVVTAAATYTAQWKMAVALDDVNCYAFIKSKGDREKAKTTLLPAEYKLEDGTTDGTTFKLDWSKATQENYDKAKSGIKNDGTYTYALNVTDPEDANTMLAVTCRLVVGPKQSETVGSGKNEKENTDYEYRWDSIVADANKAKAIITAWKGKDVVKKKPQALAIASVIDGMSVTAIEDEVFQGKKLSSITVPTGVTAIGRSAFADCPNLNTLTLPDTLTSIGMNLTDGSDKLTTMKLSVKKETTMDKDANGCYTIKHVVSKDNPEMSQTVTLPEGFPTDIAVAAPGKLTLEADFVVKAGHEVADVSLVTPKAKLKAEIIWVDDADKEIDRTEVAYGETPTHDDPTKDPAEDGTNYAFKAWTPALAEVTGPTTYKAEFETLYSITFVSDDEKTELWKKQDYKYNDKVEYGGTPNPPTKDPDDTHSYEFTGWVDTKDTKKEPTVYTSDKLPNATASVTYKAVYETLYTVTFVGEDEKAEPLWKKQDYRYNDKVEYGGTALPTKAPDDTHYYEFDGWVDTKDTKKEPTVYANDQLPNVTESVTYKAHFKAGTPVELVATYTGEPLTKVYDCNKYGAYTKDGQVVYVIEALKTIKDKFKLDLSKKKSKWIEGHKNVGFKLSLVKQFGSADVGKKGDDYTFEFKVTLTGDDAAYYALKNAVKEEGKDPAAVVKVPAEITPREVVVTPRAGLSKTYGTSDPKYPDGSWLSNDETSPLHQDLSDVAGYGVPVNTQDGKLQLSVTEAAYLMQEARLKGTKFFPGENPWLVREEGEDAGKYKILIGGMSFGDNFTVKLKDEVFTITAKNLADANVVVKTISNQQYTGKPITLDKEKLVVTYGSFTLEEGKDFTTEYKNNTEASTDTKKATVTLTGKGNYTGTREVTFSIIKTASPTATPSSGGGGSSSYRGGSSGSSFSGFDDDDFEEEAEEAETDDAETGDNGNGIVWIPAPDGNIRVNEMDYGTVLFGTDGLFRSFSIYTEDYVLETSGGEEFDGFEDEGDGEIDFEEAGSDESIELDDEGAEDEAIDIEDEAVEGPTLKRVVIKADSMKSTTDDGQEEDILLEGTDRKRYDELHLRLTDSTIQGLINNGVGEIVYELEQARLRIPLSALGSTILLPAEDAEADEDGEEFDVEDEIEIEDGGEDAATDASVPEGAGATGKTLPVDGYDIVIEQADANGLSAREQALIGDNQTLMPAYRVRVHIIPEDAQQSPTGEVDENGEPVTVPVTETLPENYTLTGVVLQLVPNDRYDLAPDEAQVLYAAIELATAEETEALEADAQVPAEDFEAPAEDSATLTEDADGLEVDVGETMIANNPALANAIEKDQASLTPAMFDESEDPMKVEVEPVEDGLYVAIVPPDWDPTPYLPEPENASEESFEEEEFSDDVDEGEFEEIGEEAGDEELEFDDAEEEELVEF